jgi:hypothetical protein
MREDPHSVANGRRRKSFQFTSSHFPPKQLYLGLFIFPLISQLYFTIVLGCYLHISSFFPWPINYDPAFHCHKSPTHSLLIRFGRRSFFSFIEIMASHMAMSYRLQIMQVNEEPAPESSLNLTLTQHPHDEDPEPREVCARLEVDPP